jgi:hypothetical protein
MKKLTQSERKTRIIARGEHSNHAHVITGDAIVETKGGNTFITIGDNGAAIRHLIETAWLAGEEKWTEEHADIDLSDIPDLVRHGDIALKKVGERKYQYIQQRVFDPLTKRIEAARD